MAKEFEVKILEIDREVVEKKLQELGAEESSENLMRRGVFNLGPLHGNTAERVRLRDNGDRVTMTYKKRDSADVGAAEEYEVEVSDFDQAYEMLTKLEWKGVFYQENRRKIYRLGEIEFMIDTWPMIPVYLEVESSSEKSVKDGMEKLGFEFSVGKNNAGSMVYESYGIDIHEYPELKF